MAKLTSAQLLEKIKPYIGDKTDEQTLSLLEDIKDTVVDNATDEAKEWKDKYDKEVEDRKTDNDNWAKKYRDTFFNGVPNDGKKDEPNDDKKDDDKPLTFDALFGGKEDK